MFSCQEVLARHSEYLDGLMGSSELEAMRAHLAECPSCGRYDRVVRHGVDLLLQDEPVSPDADFLHSLHSRLAIEDQRIAMRPASITASAALSIATVLALVTWLPPLFTADETESGELRAGVVPVSATEVAWHAASAVQPAGHTEFRRPDVSLTVNNADITLIDRGYSPLILEAPTAPPTYVNASLTTYDAR